jgi:hypothetical protein
VARSDHGLALERFDYSRVGEQWAVLRVLARLGADLRAPADAQLVVHRDQRHSQLFPTRACKCERRLLGGGDSELLWRALFAVPYDVIENPSSLFGLATAGRLALALPSPGVRAPAPRALSLAPMAADDGARLAVGQLRHRAIALATAVAVTASSTPAIALADMGAAPAGHARATEQRIEHLAGLASQRARSEAASRQHARASSRRTSTSRGPATKPATHGQAREEPAARGTAREAGLVHPSVTHIFSAPARAAPGKTSEPVCTPPVNTTTGGGAQTAGGERAAKRLAELAARSTRASCTAAGITKNQKPGGTDQGAGTTGTQGTGTGGTTGTSGTPGTSGGASIGGGTGTSGGTGTTGPVATIGSGTPTATSGHAEQSSQRPMPASVPRTTSGGSAVQPLGSLSGRPPVKLPTGGTTTGGAAATLVSSPPGFLGPKSWTGTVTTDPALTGALGNLSDLLQNGDTPPQFLIPIYMEAGNRYDVPWEVLAAINAVESDYGRNLSTSSAGAIGWMQFEPSTWHEYGVAADGDSVPNPYDPRDAIFSAARLLAAAGAAQDISRAVYSYNHASWYVDMVLTRARAIAAGVDVQRQTVKQGVVSVYFATAQPKHPTIRFKGGRLSHYDRLIASANMVSAANFPYLYGGGHEQPARFGPFDCSGSVSYVVQQAGYKVPTTVSGDIPSWKFPAGPGAVTIFYNPTHTFMRIGGRFFGTSGFARPGGGAGWFDANTLPASYLTQFREVHIPGLGGNSFAPAKHVTSTRS